MNDGEGSLNGIIYDGFQIETLPRCGVRVTRLDRPAFFYEVALGNLDTQSFPAHVKRLIRVILERLKGSTRLPRNHREAGPYPQSKQATTAGEPWQQSDHTMTGSARSTL